ncbi:MAG: pyruvate ferredoxin oxidoreductase [Desulfurococcales archaeon ex4484_58]|nr:MAG: pyruvate ferredoxin oxidoreductase [Desulfurococcales archaeon ex4484_58]
MVRYNIFIAGVGGQGLLTLGRILGNAAIEAGHDVTVAEVHGLAQRGGTLNVQVRIGPGEAPQIPRGGVDLFIALEALEALRYSSYVGRDTRIVMNKFIWPPPLAEYPSMESIIEKLREHGLKLYVVDANGLSKKILGTIISANIAMLGYSYAIDPGLQKLLEYKHLEKGLERVFRGKVLEANKKVLKESYNEGLKLI